MNASSQIAEDTIKAAGESRAAARPLSFIVAEDDRVNQMVIKAVLQKMGHAVRLVSTGREAVDAFSSSIPHAILMDIQMPEMDGLEAARLIRQSEAATKARVPIIAMTGMSAEQDQAAGLAAGFDRYLCKPVRADKLQPVVEWLLERTK